MKRLAFSALLLSTLSSLAYAQTDTGPSSPPSADPAVAITFSPIHLLIPFLEVNAEIRVTPKIGLGLTAGAGVMHVNKSTSNDKVTLVEGGISPRYYLTGSFRQGVQLGAEVQYLHASADADAMTTVSAAGLSIGPYVGYKWTAAIGLTLEAQAGVAFIAVKGSNDSTGQTDGEKRVYPLLNLNAGLSF
ncbi:hypothetical protein BH11MYX2_BH11MYX2_37930 [soil metagenome]